MHSFMLKPGNGVDDDEGKQIVQTFASRASGF